MRRLDVVRRRARDRPVLAVFVALASVPAALAVLSFRQPVPLPDAVLSELEFLFRLFVYGPVAAARRVLFEPLGLDGVFAVPGLQQATIVLVLLGFYYLASAFLVRAGRRLFDRLDARE